MTALLLACLLAALAVPLPPRQRIPDGTEVRAITLHYTVLAYCPDNVPPYYWCRQYRLDMDGMRYDEIEVAVEAGHLEEHYAEDRR